MKVEGFPHSGSLLHNGERSAGTERELQRRVQQLACRKQNGEIPAYLVLTHLRALPCTHCLDCPQCALAISPLIGGEIGVAVTRACTGY